MNPLLPRRIFEQNRIKLSKNLKKDSIAIFNSNDEMPRNGDQFFPFRQHSDLFYLTGIVQEKTKFVLSPQHPIPKNREMLFIVKPNDHLETWYGKKLTKMQATEISGIQSVFWIDEFDQVMTEQIYFCEHIYVNQYENSKVVSEVESSDLRFTRDLKNRFPAHHFERLAPIMTNLRVIKEHDEINIIRHACDITSKAFQRVLRNINPGMHEFEVEAEISYEFRKNGAQGHAYAPIVASGRNACILHYTDNHAVCADGDLLLMDFGAEFANYASDCSRTIPVNGRFTSRQKQLYKATLSVLHKAKPLMVKGTTIALLNKQVGKLWEEEHVRLGLYSQKDILSQDAEYPLYTKYFMHGISHFLGLDVHDVGSRLQTLEPGMVLTLEPGIYIREEGLGIRLENDILITEDNPIDLMQEIPIEAEEIEELMRRS
jgi:Xaa-Pro aminopeptidase